MWLRNRSPNNFTKWQKFETSHTQLGDTCNSNTKRTLAGSQVPGPLLKTLSDHLLHLKAHVPALASRWKQKQNDGTPSKLKKIRQYRLYVMPHKVVRNPSKTRLFLSSFGWNNRSPIESILQSLLPGQ